MKILKIGLEIQVGFGSIPPWLDALLNEKFFEPCLVHNHNDPSATKKPEKNIFCFDCCISVCPKCLHRHRRHVLLQVINLYTIISLLSPRVLSGFISNSESVLFLGEEICVPWCSEIGWCWETYGLLWGSSKHPRLFYLDFILNLRYPDEYSSIQACLISGFFWYFVSIELKVIHHKQCKSGVLKTKAINTAIQKPRRLLLHL